MWKCVVESNVKGLHCLFVDLFMKGLNLHQTSRVVGFFTRRANQDRTFQSKKGLKTSTKGFALGSVRYILA